MNEMIAQGVAGIASGAVQLGMSGASMMNSSEGEGEIENANKFKEQINERLTNGPQTEIRDELPATREVARQPEQAPAPRNGQPEEIEMTEISRREPVRNHIEEQAQARQEERALERSQEAANNQAGNTAATEGTTAQQRADEAQAKQNEQLEKMKNEKFKWGKENAEEYSETIANSDEEAAKGMGKNVDKYIKSKREAMASDANSKNLTARAIGEALNGIGSVVAGGFKNDEGQQNGKKTIEDSLLQMAQTLYSSLQTNYNSTVQDRDSIYQALVQIQQANSTRG